MAHRSVVPATGQLIKTRDEISDSESSAAFTSTQSCSENAWCTTPLPERAELRKAVVADLPNHVAEHAALPVIVPVWRHYAAAVGCRLSKGVMKCR
jgi:acyl-CoA reductase-like NAD-dependent aldehyde dehydrogenase